MSWIQVILSADVLKYVILSARLICVYFDHLIINDFIICIFLELLNNFIIIVEDFVIK